MDCSTSEARSGTSKSREFLASNQAVYREVNRKLPVAEFKALGGGEHNYRSFQKRVPQLFSFIKNEVNL